MTERKLPSGKLPAGLLQELLDAGPALPPDVLVGPGIGEDACVIEVEAGVLVAATDPITMTGSAVGGHAVVINANDVAVTGVRPRYFLASVLLPGGSSESDVRALFADMRAELARVGASLVGGHTEVTDAVSQTVVVGQMLGVATPRSYVRSSGVRAGHRILQVGAAPVEGALVLARGAGERLGSLDPSLLRRALDSLDDPGISVVEPALKAAELGASALHDPTEGGLSAGLHELAQASGIALVVDHNEVVWYEPGLALCRAVGADPWGTLASGTVLAAFPEPEAERALEVLIGRGYPAARIARAEPGAGVRLESGAELRRYERDELSRVL